MKLTAENVSDVMLRCLWPEGDSQLLTPAEREALIARSTIARGVRLQVAADPERVERQRSTIDDLLDQTDPRFRDGWTFLNFCGTGQSGEIWTGEHAAMDTLLVLGLLIGRIEYCMPREQWSLLPAGLPYLIVKERAQ